MECSGSSKGKMSELWRKGYLRCLDDVLHDSEGNCKG